MTKVEDLRREYYKVLSESKFSKQVRIKFAEETLEELKAGKTVIGRGTVEFPTEKEMPKIRSFLAEGKQPLSMLQQRNEGK